jgi:hypothetical protein
MLKTAMKYAKEENGQVPVSHIDYVYDQIVTYIKGKSERPQNQEARKERSKKKGRSKRIYKR